MSVVYQTERLDVRPWTTEPADVDRIFEAFRLAAPDRGRRTRSGTMTA